MDAETSIKRHILQLLFDETRELVPTQYEPPHVIILECQAHESSVEEIWDALMDDCYGEVWLTDELEFFRSNGDPTDLPERPSAHTKHYQSAEVATVLCDGKAVAWTYYSGGGKHGDPSELDWLDQAYFVDCEQVPKIVRVYSPWRTLEPVTKSSLFREALGDLVDAPVPGHFEYRAQDDLADVMQNWVAEHARYVWSTGIGTIEAAEHMVDVAVDNGNVALDREVES